MIKIVRLELECRMKTQITKELNVPGLIGPNCKYTSYNRFMHEINREVVFLLWDEGFDFRWFPLIASWFRGSFLLCTRNLRYFIVSVGFIALETHRHVLLFFHCGSDHILFTTALTLQASRCWPSWYDLVNVCALCTLSRTNSTSWLQTSGWSNSTCWSSLSPWLIS